MLKCAVITVSDKGYAGEREDISGAVARKITEQFGFENVYYKIVPDEKEKIKEAIVFGCVVADLVLTTGGTGFSMRDVTPEATAEIVERRADGIVQAMIAHALTKTDRAMLSRGIAGIKGDSLVVNLPGSPKAVEEDLTYALPSLIHGIEILLGTAGECAKKE